MKISKCKKELARIISDNGGWPERALWAVQDNCIAFFRNCIVFFRGGKPEYKSGDRCWYSNCLDGACVGTITRDEKVTNWHQTILSREEYFHLYPSPDADGWVEWGGGECPVGEDDRIDVKFSDCDTLFDVDSNWDWGGDVDMCNIIAYRLHKPEQSKPEFCESVMRSIPEPIAKPTIEQLAADYRNAKSHAERLQKEAGEASVKAESFAVEIRKKILELQELIGISKPDSEPELVITDWRDLQVNDVIFVGEYDEHESGEYVVIELEDRDYGGGYAVKAAGIDGNEWWIDTAREWGFIRRP